MLNVARQPFVKQHNIEDFESSHLLSSPGCDNNVVEKIVSSFNLVPVEQMALTELKVFNVVLLHKRLSCNIQHGKQPTPSTTLLICHRLSLNFNLMVVYVHSVFQAASLQACLQRVRPGADIERQSILLTAEELLSQLCQNLLRQLSLHPGTGHLDRSFQAVSLKKCIQAV